MYQTIQHSLNWCKISPKLNQNWKKFVLNMSQNIVTQNSQFLVLFFLLGFFLFHIKVQDTCTWGWGITCMHRHSIENPFKRFKHELQNVLSLQIGKSTLILKVLLHHLFTYNIWLPWWPVHFQVQSVHRSRLNVIMILHLSLLKVSLPSVEEMQTKSWITFPAKNTMCDSYIVGGFGVVK